MTTTNASYPHKRFTLAEMSSVMLDRKNIAVGFFVSQALWDHLSSRVRKENGFGLGSQPIALHGVKIALDQGLPESEFDVAFTEEAWSKRLATLSGPERK